MGKLGNVKGRVGICGGAGFNEFNCKCKEDACLPTDVIGTISIHIENLYVDRRFNTSQQTLKYCSEFSLSSLE